MERNYRKLWWQHCLAIICFSVVPLLFVNISLYVLFDRIYTDTVTETLRSSAENRRDAIDLFFSERIAQLFTVANTNTFKDLTDENYLNRVFDIMHAKSTSYMDIGIIDNEGRHLSYVGPYYDLLKQVNYKNEPWFNAVKANGIYISDIFMGYRKVPHFIIAVMVREKSTSWILRVTINLKNIDDIVHKAWIGTLSDAYIVNGKNILQTRPRFGGDFLEPAGGPDFSSTVATKISRLAYKGSEAFYAAIPVANTKWVLVIKENPDEILSPLQKGKYWMAFLSLLGLTIIATGAALFTNTLINRIEETDRENAANSDMLLQANKMIALSKMAAGIAHEVNNPLASISEKAGWMKDLLAEEDIAASPNFAEFSESIDKIEYHVDRARKIVHNLLGFARRMEPAKEKININNLLDETTGLLENEARYVNILIKKQYAENVPVITSDLSQIQQVVLNLLNNAIDAIGSDGTITVGSRYLEDTDQVELWVADTGKGIPEAEQSKIFEPFFTTKAVGKGTGLGLSISYSIIEKLGGKMRVQSKVGEGTMFTILLPKN
ncbi:integral membrane sensor signal transduction histidine kinase [Desulfobulbus propionicus DSM 2032]|uniref:histidine kinase n=1 Tax=Desulfobulbus propionicus (strain ATCC 33891 / DSM 2032 / VKM B-1956 / 1pr3) TaxID=577650 RepID=A0A7U3YP75_DESPD|nr:PAS domain-containing sensor histidine kinase [Desulfobulbus propionicus]ADW18995.1 integral membrane sensor signal transduction histidine kinase [Desulfobulbus propionicus DSM 2032]